ncbi:MAG: porin family protein [Bacteroidales bacterium]|jgi:opacity protein-like surface antigen|nr:porin family protein [Bacteroidales bacterium]
MKTPIIVISLLFSCVSASAQFFAGINGKIGDGNFVNRDWATKDTKGTWSCVGINAGYEFVKRIPVSVGVEYAVLHTTGKFSEFYDGKFIRMPVTAGYCHYFGNIRLFANAGMFASFGKGNNEVTFRDANGAELLHVVPKIKLHWGYTLQGGAAYRIMDKLLLSLSFEYNRPIKEKIEKDNRYMQFDEHTWPSYRFVGVTIGASWYFSKPARPLLVASPSPVRH